MSNTITNAIGVQQTTLVKNSETLTTCTSNPRKCDRDLMRALNSNTAYVAATNFNDTLSVFIGPAQGFGRGHRKDVELFAGKLANPHLFPSQIEIEFSASPTDVFTAAEGLPEDYRQSAIDWALSISRAVMIAVNHHAKGSVVEPYAVLQTMQMVIRCDEHAIPAWVEYLGRRLRPRQRFALLRMEEQA